MAAPRTVSVAVPAHLVYLFRGRPGRFPPARVHVPPISPHPDTRRVHVLGDRYFLWGRGRPLIFFFRQRPSHPRTREKKRKTQRKKKHAYLDHDLELGVRGGSGLGRHGRRGAAGAQTSVVRRAGEGGGAARGAGREGRRRKQLGRCLRARSIFGCRSFPAVSPLAAATGGARVRAPHRSTRQLMLRRTATALRRVSFKHARWTHRTARTTASPRGGSECSPRRRWRPHPAVD